MSTVKQISTLAKKIYAKKPTIKWTEAIKQASRELKASGKISAGKSRATKSTATKRKPVTKRITGVAKKKPSVPSTIKLEAKNLNSTQDKYKYKSRYYEILDDQDGDLYIFYGGKAIYFKKPYPRIGATKYPKPKLFKPTPAQTKAAAKRLVKQSTSKRKVGGSHTDTKSHNVRINVLSGLQGSPQVFNGVKTLTKGGYYLYMDKPNTLFKFIGRDNKKTAFPLVFDIYKKSSQGGYYLAARYEYASELIKYLSKIKKPSSKELAIGHLKLPK